MASLKAQLEELETVIKDNGYTLRFEKGNFNSGYCVVNMKKIIIVNKYFDKRDRIGILKSIVADLKFEALKEETAPEPQYA